MFPDVPHTGLPLSGLKVIDCTIWQQGTYASAMLADFGADVIKVEGPDSPDPGRGVSDAYFESHNRNKRGIVLDLRDMRAFDIDLAQRTASAQAGLTAGEYTALAGEHGLATGFGDTGSVGIGGITLGGGVGLLSRKHGLTVDDLLAAEVVTADGRILDVDADADGPSTCGILAAGAGCVAGAG